MLDKKTFLFETQEDIEQIKHIVLNEHQYDHAIKDIVLYAAYGASRASLSLYKTLFSQTPILTTRSDVHDIHALLLETNFFSWYDLSAIQCSNKVKDFFAKRGDSYKPLIEYLTIGRIKTRQSPVDTVLEKYMLLPTERRVPFIMAYIAHYVDPATLLLDANYYPCIEGPHRQQLIEQLSSMPKNKKTRPLKGCKEVELFL